MRYIHNEAPVRTNIDIDDELMAKAMTLSGHKTKRETVEAALELLVTLKSQEAIRAARGKLKWEGDLEAMRRDR
jgi:Arc/MetJ family transcription regulator